MTIKVSDLIADFFVRRGMRHVFGIIGAGNLHIFDSIGTRGAPAMICTHHEQAATMAATAYYRASGQITAAILTTGAGSTNGLTGVVGAWMDSIPLLVISGNENSRHARDGNPLRVWGVQGYDSSGVVEKVTKYAKRVSDPTQILYELEKACHIALTGKPGPCWLDIPMDIQSAQIDEAELPHFDVAHLDLPALDDLAAAARQTVTLLRAAKRPILWLGHGIRLAGAADKVRHLLDAVGAPAIISWAGLDLIDSDHPQVYGRAGVSGHRAANFVLQNSDLVVAIGTRLAYPQIGYVLDELARDAEIVCVDIDPLEAKKHGHRVKYPIVADAGAFIDALIAAAEKMPTWPDWRARCDRYRNDYPWIEAIHADKPPFLNSYLVMNRLAEFLKPGHVVVTDAGTAFVTGQQTVRLKDGQRFIGSTGLGEMGFGLPGSIGASIALDKGEVLCLNCDGSMMMNLQELQTIAHHQLPIKVLIFSNDGYLSIKQSQTNIFNGRRIAVDPESGVSCPSFKKIGAAFGIPTWEIHSWDDFEKVMPLVQAESGPAMVEIFVDPQQLFVPKLSTGIRADGALVSPPLEDLAPFLSRDAMREAMIVGMHPKSEGL